MARPKSVEPRNTRLYNLVFPERADMLKAQAWAKAQGGTLAAELRRLLNREIAAWEKQHGGLTLPPPAG